jgi:hypothetical protein
MSPHLPFFKLSIAFFAFILLTPLFLSSSLQQLTHTLESTLDPTHSTTLFYIKE